MANPTTNYGWPMPTSSDLVTDLPADFDAFGQPVDNTLKALNPETTLGDISYRSAVSNTNTRLGIGTAGQVLAVSGGVPAWTTTADVTPLTTKGDLFTFTTEDARLPVGTDGYTLVADSVETTGLKWAAPASGGGMTLLNSGNTTLSGSAFSITSISGSYNDLVLNIYGLNPSSATALATLTFNSDTATNYPHATCDFVAGVSNNTLNQENANGISLHRFGRQYLGQNTDNFWRYNIYGYTRTGNRTIAETFSQDGGSTPSVGYGAINYEGSSAITSLTITLDTGTFSAGTLEVYGVK